jgi:hypothetical protein
LYEMSLSEATGRKVQTSTEAMEAEGAMEEWTVVSLMELSLLCTRDDDAKSNNSCCLDLKGM